MEEVQWWEEDDGTSSLLSVQQNQIERRRNSTFVELKYWLLWIYETSLDTLRKDQNSMIGAMFSGKYKMETDEDGHYFIDSTTLLHVCLTFQRRWNLV
jgi:hypothetical protein